MSPTEKPILGLLGGIGSGKSAVAAELVKHGGWLINADQLGHEALRQPEISAQVIERFGVIGTDAHGKAVARVAPNILDTQSSIDRKKLGAMVFKDETKLRALEAIVFPYIGRRIREEIDLAKQRDDVRFIVLDAAVMLEAGWSDACDKVIFVDAPRDLRLQRVRQQRGWTEADLRARENLQLPLDEKRRRADAVIDNSTTPPALADQVSAVLQTWGLA